MVPDHLIQTTKTITYIVEEGFFPKDDAQNLCGFLENPAIAFL